MVLLQSFLFLSRRVIGKEFHLFSQESRGVFINIKPDDAAKKENNATRKHDKKRCLNILNNISPYVHLLLGEENSKEKLNSQRNSQVKSYSISIAYSHLIQHALPTAQSLHTSPAELMVDRATAG